MKDADAEALDADTLMSLLREKAKELKKAQNKIRKIEDKFVDFHKTHISLQRDRETFLEFLRVVFPQKLLEEEILLIPEGPEGYGKIDLNHLSQFWQLTT